MTAGAGGKRLETLEVLRGLAALSVLLYHVSATASGQPGMSGVAPQHVGAAGVDVFFVLSGFLMAGLAATGRVNAPLVFLWERLSRIAPLYYAVTLAAFAIALAMPQLMRTAESDWVHLALSLAFLPWMEHGQLAPPLFFIGWSLNYEVFFYALVALSAALGDKRLGTVLLILLTLTLLQQNGILTGAFSFYGDPIILEFGFGIVAWHLWTRNRVRALPLGWLIGLGAIALSVFGMSEPGEWRALIWGVPAMLIVLGAASIQVPVFSRIAVFGQTSYALYLTHVFVVTLYMRQLVPAVEGLGIPWAVHVLVMVVLCQVLAWAVWTWFDRPVSRMMRNALPLTGMCSASAGMAGRAA